MSSCVMMQDWQCARVLTVSHFISDSPPRARPSFLLSNRTVTQIPDEQSCTCLAYHLPFMRLHLFRLHLGAQPQICELDVAVPVQQNVVGFEIAVNVPQLVHLGSKIFDKRDRPPTRSKFCQTSIRFRTTEMHPIWCP